MRYKMSRNGERSGILQSFVVVLVLIAFAAMLFLGRWWGTTGVVEVVVNSSPTFTQLKSLGELVVLRVEVDDVLEAVGEGHKDVWLIKGDGLVSVDLRRAKFKSSDSDRKR